MGLAVKEGVASPRGIRLTSEWIRDGLRFCVGDAPAVSCVVYGDVSRRSTGTIVPQERSVKNVNTKSAR